MSVAASGRISSSSSVADGVRRPPPSLEDSGGDLLVLILRMAFGPLFLGLWIQSTLRSRG